MPPSNLDSSRAGGFRTNVTKFWIYSYASDYLAFALVFAGYILLVVFAKPFHRMFYINNLNISFPHAAVEQVPVWLNIVYSGVVPLSLFVIYNSITKASFHKHHNTLLGFAIAISLTCFLTDIVKNTVGRPRPDLIARCKPAPDTKPNVLVTYEVCTQPPSHSLNDGWRSFPSGHASFSFAGLGYLTFFLAGQLRIFHDRKGFARALVCLAPLLGATMIGISRCQDYRHDVYDVSVGSLLGLSIAYWSYRRYWPQLSSRDCHEPYPVLGMEMEHGEGWRRALDEEEAGSISDRNFGYEMAVLG